jgi:uncharacterized membrane protein
MAGAAVREIEMPGMAIATTSYGFVPDLPIPPPTDGRSKPFMAIQPRRSEVPGRSEIPGHDRRPAAKDRRGHRLEGVDGATATDERLAQGLGWFSIALGLAETIMPRAVARLAGMPPRRGLLRAYGVRELASGVGILSQRRPAMWLWSRVAGDAIDLATLAGALTSRRSRRGRILVATAAVAGVTALDVLAARRLSRDTGRATTDTPGGVRIRTSVTVNRPPDEVYRFWRDFSNLARVMRHIESVHVHGERRSHWVAVGPGGTRLEWDAEIIDDRPGELISWRSVPGGDVQTEGVVRFVAAPGRRGTEVHVDMQYRTSLGLVGSMVGRWFGGAASTLAHEDLRPLKQILETGEIPTSDGSPSARARDMATGGRQS